MYWEDGEGRRVLASYGSWPYALQAQTGQPIPDFGEDGRIHPGDDLDVSNISAGGAKTNRPAGSSIVAFALPD